MIISSFGLTTQQMLDATRPGAQVTQITVQPHFEVREEQSPGLTPKSFLDEPWAKWAIGGGVALMLGGAYWYTRRRRKR